MLHFVKGNMFDIEADVRVNTVNCKGVMGAGVALAFKNRYPQMFLEYREACLADEIQPGKMYVWRSSTGDWVINFPTKRHWREKSRYEDIALGLNALRDYLKQFPGVKVALPALGCGNGGLDWTRVAPMISDNLGKLDAEIFVFEPADSLNMGRKVVAQSRDNMMRELESLGFSRFQVPFEFHSQNEIDVQVKGNAELLVNGWIALSTSHDMSDRELAALTSIAEQMGLIPNPPTVALIYQNSASEEVAQIFLKNGLAVVLLLPFSPRVKKRIGLATDHETRITYAILSVGDDGDGNLKKNENSAEELLRKGAYALLLSHPEPKFGGKNALKPLVNNACFYIRYATHTNEVISRLEHDGFKAIGRRADTGEPNLLPLIDVKNNAFGLVEDGVGTPSQITTLASADQLRELAELLERKDANRSGVYMSLVLDLLPNDVRFEVGEIFKHKKFRATII